MKKQKTKNKLRFVYSYAIYDYSGELIMEGESNNVEEIRSILEKNFTPQKVKKFHFLETRTRIYDTEYDLLIGDEKHYIYNEQVKNVLKKNKEVKN